MVTPQELKQIDLFVNLSHAACLAVAGVCTRRSYEKGALVQLANDPCAGVYFVLEGVVQVYRSSAEGREQVLANLSQSGMFNIVPPLSENPHNRASVRASTRCELIMLSTEYYRRLLSTNPEFSSAMLVEFARRLTHLSDLVETLSLYPVRVRMARFLLKQADQKNPQPFWTQDEIAAQLGTVRDVVGRTLRSFEDGGLLRRSREKILLLDRKGLEDEAGFE